MNRKVFCGRLWVHPIDGTKKAKRAAAAAHRNLCVKEIMRSLFGVLFWRTYAIRDRGYNAKPAPRIPSPPPAVACREGGGAEAEQPATDRSASKILPT